MPLDKCVAALRTGRLKPENIEPINLYVLNGKIVSSDHRRLVAARLAGVKVRYKLAPKSDWEKALKDKVDINQPPHEIEIRKTRQKKGN